MSTDTIFALASGRPPAAIAVVRISGPGAFAATQAIAGALPLPRRAALRTLRDGAGEVLDRALVLTFPGPSSATGEDVCELHLHGGRAVIAAVEMTLGHLPGLRPAVAGEFTRRALANGRIDLAMAEGLADLLAAETQEQRRLAQATAGGQVSTLLTGWADRLALLAARVEAAIDFSDEGEVAETDDQTIAVLSEIEALAGEWQGWLAQPPVERWRDGIKVVLGGPPNAGKSTLFNLLVGRDAAIVSPTAGTTRDRIEASVTRSGMPFVLIDTAGIHEEASDPIEREGIARSGRATFEADVLLWLGDDEPPAHSGQAISLHPRADLPGRSVGMKGRTAVRSDDPTSIAAVWTLIEDRARDLLPSGEIALNRRQRDALVKAHDALVASEHDVLLLAETLRVAHLALSDALGRHAPEAMLDALFGRFCIGK